MALQAKFLSTSIGGSIKSITVRSSEYSTLRASEEDRVNHLSGCSRRLGINRKKPKT